MATGHRTGHGLTRRVALKSGMAAAGLSSASARANINPSYTQALLGGRLEIYALSPRALRVCFGRSKPHPSPILLSEKTVPAHVDAAGATIHLPFIRCTVAADGALSFHDANGNLVLAEAPGSRRLEPASVQGEATFAVSQSFASPADERLYGTGQFQDGFLNVRGLSRRLTQVNTQISLPFLMSSKGCGLLWHNAGMTELNRPDRAIVPKRVAGEGSSATVNVTTTGGNAAMKRVLATFEGTFEIAEAGRYCLQLDVGQAMAHKHYVEVDGQVVVDVDSLWLPPTTSFFAELAAGTHTLRVVGSSKDEPRVGLRRVCDTTELFSPVADGVDYVVIAGPNADDILAEYRRLTGEAPMMPKWAFGYIHCRERFHSSDEILANAREFRTRNIPMDVMVQDWQYWGRYGWNAMRFDEADYPDPAAMIAGLHGMNARLMLSVWSKADPKSDVGKAFSARGAFIAGTDWIDFFNPRAAGFYWGAMSHRLLKLGVDAWWQDATEPENDDLVGRRTAAGPGERVRLMYPLTVSRTVYEGQRRDAPDRRVMILTRSAFPGQQRYASATWSGDIGCDWDTLKRQIPAGLNMMAAGHPYWTVDAGGFFRPGPSQYGDPAYHDVLLRWLQYAVFLPLMRVHGYQTTTEPWHYGPDVEQRIRALIELRYRLLPYIYSAAADVTRRGTSLMRPLVLDFGHDAAALDEAHSYMFGKALHVAPVFKPDVKAWPVYLPAAEGGWYDFHTGAHRAGGARYDVEAAEHVPVHVRAGAIVPLGPVVQSTAEADGRDLEINIYAGAEGAFDLYEDEGTNYGYEKGRFSVIAFRWRDKSRDLAIAARRGRYPGMAERRTFRIRLIGGAGQAPITVAYDGRAQVVRL